MIRDGIPIDEVEPYLHARAWLTDAARLLDRTPEALAAELIDTMLRSGAIALRDKRLHATAEHTSGEVSATRSLRLPHLAAAAAGTPCSDWRNLERRRRAAAH
jgi:hypothetical protein